MQNPVHYWPVLFFFMFCMTLVVLSTLKSFHFFVDELRLLEGFVGGDKCLHFYLSLILGFLGCFSAVRMVTSRRRWLAVSVTLISLMVGLFLDEYMQQFSENRIFDPMDLYAGTLGLLTGLVIYILISFLGCLFRRV